jgi:hypothetical protein
LLLLLLLLLLMSLLVVAPHLNTPAASSKPGQLVGFRPVHHLKINHYRKHEQTAESC